MERIIPLAREYRGRAVTEAKLNPGTIILCDENMEPVDVEVTYLLDKEARMLKYARQALVGVKLSDLKNKIDTDIAQNKGV